MLSVFMLSVIMLDVTAPIEVNIFYAKKKSVGVYCVNNISVIQQNDIEQN